MGTTPFSELRDAHYAEHPEARERVAAKVARLRDELGLGELRERSQRTQAEIAEELGTAQSGISRLERQGDAKVSTLRDFVAATGGRLRLIADYPDRQYEIALGEPDRPDHAFAVIWQDPDTRQLVHVGRLAATDDGRFAFAYTVDAELHRGFEPFDDMPDLDIAYEADGLFPFLADRIMSAADPAYDDLLAALGLTRDEATPVELLARSAAAAIDDDDDTVQVVPEPRVRADGTETRRFLVSGCRHADEDADRAEVTRRIAELHPGDELALVDEPDNEFNPRAIQLHDPDGRQVGWVPDYLLDYVHKRRGEGAVRALVERANGPDTPWHLRILARLEHRPGS